jgi:hypothetical protein
MKLTFDNIDQFIGRKVRIVKVCAPFIGSNILGKVDYIESTNNCIFLKNLKTNVNPNWIELVDDDAIDIEMELNENTIFNPFL